MSARRYDPASLRYVSLALLTIFFVMVLSVGVARAVVPGSVQTARSKAASDITSNSVSGSKVIPSSNGGPKDNTLFVVGAVTPTVAPTATPSPTCTPLFAMVDSPNQGTAASILAGVSARASNDIWAVGFYYVEAGGRQLPLTEHWDGTQWSIFLPPLIGIDSSKLGSVSARAADDVWAVGYWTMSVGVGYTEQTLAYHWNGSEWNVITTPNGGQQFAPNVLTSVTALSADDAWAVGGYSEGQGGATLAEHWNGTAWNVVTTLNPGSYNNVFSGVSASGPDDVWAVGMSVYAGVEENFTLVEHWNGSAWSVVPSVDPRATANYLLAVAALAPDDVWAVGDAANTGGPQVTLIEHWNGSAWSVVPSPSPGSIANVLYSISAISPDSIWAVGDYENDHILQLTMALHWDGSNWSQVPTENPGPDSNDFSGVSALDDSNVWAVGRRRDSNSFLTLTEHYNQGCPNGTSTPTPTTATTPTAGSSATATATSAPTLAVTATTVPPTHALTPTATINATETGTAISTATPLASGTATANATETRTAESTATPLASGTATATTTPPLTATTGVTATATAATCLPGRFTDVDTCNPFYPYIACLVNHNIVSGYSDGTFRPNNNVTRGQLSKIVSNSAGFSDPQPTQMFEDVLIGSTFQVYIGRLASRGYISGYPCGGVGEPCGVGNLPYFRPNNNATRGQISKIDANAAGFIDPPGAQLFEDVAPGSTFYDYIQRLASRGIINGYPCGGTGEPCGVGNLPYFRPNNNATRGQTSKIVANTFFPGCQTPSKR
jgi:hypothetical protein